MQLKEYEYFGERKRYRLIRKLGSGGFSEVWLAEDTKASNMEVALKVYASVGGLDEEGVRMFSNEFSLLFNMTHSNLLKPTHFDDYENRPFLAMPFCKNGSAQKLVGNITEADAWRCLHDVSSGLAYLHSLTPPVIHQDISTENILIDEHGNFMITDFGISTKARNTLRKSAINLQDSQEGGKVDFMAPELFGVKNEPIKASDIWALGVTMYELLEGRLPFPQGLGGLARKGGADVPIISGEYSKELKDTVYKMLSKDPWDRPTAETIKKQIEQSGADGSSRKSSKVWLPITIVAAVLIAGAAAIFFFFPEILPHGEGGPPQPDSVTNKQFNLHGRTFIYTGWELNGMPQDSIGVAVYEAGFLNTGKGLEEEGICTYRGRFNEGYRQGQGKLEYENGDWYKGRFQKDYMHGKGDYYWAADSSYFDGNCENNQLINGIIRDGDGNVIAEYKEGIYIPLYR